MFERKSFGVSPFLTFEGAVKIRDIDKPAGGGNFSNRIFGVYQQAGGMTQGGCRSGNRQRPRLVFVLKKRLKAVSAMFTSAAASASRTGRLKLAFINSDQLFHTHAIHIDIIGIV